VSGLWRLVPAILGLLAGGFLLLVFGVNAVVILSYRPNDPGADAVWPAVLTGVAGWGGMWWLLVRHFGRRGISLLRAAAEVIAMFAATVAGVALVVAVLA
jgi:hypothetical protein